MLYIELGIVTILIVTNGLLSMSELAIVSSRPASPHFSHCQLICEGYSWIG